MFRDSSFKAVHGQMITFLWKQISQALRLPVGREAFCRPTEETSGIINDCVIYGSLAQWKVEDRLVFVVHVITGLLHHPSKSSA